MFSGLESPTHLLIVLLIILLLFGAQRLPEVGQSLGRGIREFKEGLNAKEEPQKKHASDVEEVEASKKAYDEGGPYQKGETAHTRDTDL